MQGHYHCKRNCFWRWAGICWWNDACQKPCQSFTRAAICEV